MANTVALMKLVEEGEMNDSMSPKSLKKMSDSSRRDTADEAEEEADRLMAELKNRVPSMHAVKVEDDDDDEIWNEGDDDEESEIDSKVHTQKNATANVSAKFTCPLCRKQFQKEGGLRRHMNALHPNGQALRFKCEKCGKGFARRHHLKNHEATHGPPSARCDLCPATFACKETLVIHKARDHKMTMDNQPVSAAISCPTCQQLFETPLQLRNHSYLCRRNLANKEIKRVEKLTRLPTRSKEPKEKAPVAPCEKCGKSFSSQCGKTRHIRKHHPTFAEELKADKDAWRESLPHACELCGKRFRQSVDLKYHYMRHTGALPFKCGKCDCAYPLASELNKHESRVHPDTDHLVAVATAEDDGSSTKFDDDLAIFY